MVRRNAAAKAPTYLSRSALCHLAGIDEGQLTIWEHEELIVPARMFKIEGHTEPLYTQHTLDRIRVIRTLADELEVNIPGIAVILNLLDRISG